MSGPKLKIAKMPDTTLLKVSIALDPPLTADLKTYAKIYEASYGQKASITVLIPLMLRAFIDSDASFKKARREFVENQS